MHAFALFQLLLQANLMITIYNNENTSKAHLSAYDKVLWIELEMKANAAKDTKEMDPCVCTRCR